MKRPKGITILAVINFVGALLCALGSPLFFLGLGLAGAGAKAAGAGTGGVVAPLLSLGSVLGVVMLISAVIAAVVGVGLWKLHNWARILYIILTALSLLFVVLGLLMSVLHFHAFAVVMRLVSAGIHALFLWYMFQPHVKQAFGAT